MDCCLVYDLVAVVMMCAAQMCESCFATRLVAVTLDIIMIDHGSTNGTYRWL